MFRMPQSQISILQRKLCLLNLLRLIKNYQQDTDKGKFISIVSLTDTMQDTRQDTAMVKIRLATLPYHGPDHPLFPGTSAGFIPRINA